MGQEMLDLPLVHGQIVQTCTGKILHSDSDIDNSKSVEEPQRRRDGQIWKGDEN